MSEPPISIYWPGVEWVRYTLREITKHSLENKVDELWSCIFSHYFPFSEGYRVVMREPVDDSTNAPDITVKRLRNGVCHTILTMENKRAFFESHTTKWKEAVEELEEYLDRVPHAAKPDPAFEVGLVGIGTCVRFYCRQDTQSLVDYPDCGINALNVGNEALEIHSFISDIKRRMGG